MTTSNQVAERGPPTVAGRRVSLGYEKLVLADNLVHTLQAIPAPAARGFPPTFALIRIRASAADTAAGAGVAWRDDGADPTATDGMPAEAGKDESYPADPVNLRFIRLTAAPVTLHISYYW
jgi:hypothetical protein